MLHGIWQSLALSKKPVNVCQVCAPAQRVAC